MFELFCMVLAWTFEGPPKRKPATELGADELELERQLDQGEDARGQRQRPGAAASRRDAVAGEIQGGG
jgi:hypothetical protein